METGTLKLTDGYEINETQASLFARPSKTAPETIEQMPSPESTLMNTRTEVALPGFLLLDVNEVIAKGEMIGEGGCARIYKAKLLDAELQQRYNVNEVAIKYLFDDTNVSAERNQQRFQQEISIMWSVHDHPNVIMLIGYSLNPRCIVTKLYETDLFQLVQNPKMEIISHMSMMISLDIAMGMTAVHRAGIIHRDLKSPNILMETVTQDGKSFLRAVVCDFGIAAVAAGITLENQSFINVRGLSPRYTAPEVFVRLKQKQANVSVEEEMKGDVYSFAVILWELTTRKRPWDNLPLDQIERNIIEGKREELNKAKETSDLYSQFLNRLITQCWSQAPSMRPNFSQITEQLKNSL